ncbi:hypothetical protein PsorP6_010697 [Peronosclerospora sorghi]|uniref:Uncharacterized protein n=1 Tax=Peronosclerospora sorghi TaxID=230839 RepID=A0ACC0VWQ6_9STRA|nr:hypothetical protein PsorP6_010697 [Peronosclerospora sorghi]
MLGGRPPGAKPSELIILGHVLHSSVSRSADKVEVGDSLPLVEDYVKSIENELRLLRTESRGAKEIPPFPLHSTSDNVMSKGMLEELKMSWKNYHEHFEPELKTTTDMLLGLFHTLLTEVSFDVLKWKSTSHDRLLKLVHYLSLLTVSDIIRCGFDEETLHVLAPKLSKKSRKVVAKAVILFGTKKLPYWLAFEVECRLQIRHEQFVIARHLIDRPGTVCQLNMGRGKTRVIVPMLFLHFTRRRC